MTETSRLRDPIWQAVGAIASILALVISLLAIDFSEPRLSVIRAHSWPVASFVPGEVFAVVRRDTKEEVATAIADYFLIRNESRRAIHKEHFRTPITIRPVSGKIISAIPCPDGQTFSGAYIGEIAFTAPAAVRFEGGSVIVDIDLLNRAEFACIVVFTVESIVEPISTERLSVSARLLDFEFVYSGSLANLISGEYRSVLDFFYVNIHLIGPAVYLFLGAQLLLFALATLLAYRAKFLEGTQVMQVTKLCLLVALSTATAEVLIAFRDLGFQLHVASWPTLLGYVGLVVLLASRAWKNNARQQRVSDRADG